MRNFEKLFPGNICRKYFPKTSEMFAGNNFLKFRKICMRKTVKKIELGTFQVFLYYNIPKSKLQQRHFLGNLLKLLE